MTTSCHSAHDAITSTLFSPDKLTPDSFRSCQNLYTTMPWTQLINLDEAVYVDGADDQDECEQSLPTSLASRIAAIRLRRRKRFGKESMECSPEQLPLSIARSNRCPTVHANSHTSSSDFTDAELVP